MKKKIVKEYFSVELKNGRLYMLRRTIVEMSGKNGSTEMSLVKDDNNQPEGSEGDESATRKMLKSHLKNSLMGKYYLFTDLGDMEFLVLTITTDETGEHYHFGLPITEASDIEVLAYICKESLKIQTWMLPDKETEYLCQRLAIYLWTGCSTYIELGSVRGTVHFRGTKGVAYFLETLYPDYYEQIANLLGNMKLTKVKK